MTRPPTIHQARRVCSETGARGVIVLALDDDQVAGVSYGATSAAYRVVGNACCPPVVEALGRAVHEALERAKIQQTARTSR